MHFEFGILLCNKAVDLEFLDFFFCVEHFLIWKTFRCPNCKYNGSYVNIYASVLRKRFEFKNGLYIKVLVFEFLVKLYIEELLIWTRCRQYDETLWIYFFVV
jgi:hypothetical protein